MVGLSLLYLVPGCRSEVVKRSNYKGMKRLLYLVKVWFGLNNLFQKAPNLHLVSWGLPAFKTVLALSMGHVEGDNISGLCNLGTLFYSSSS